VELDSYYRVGIDIGSTTAKVVVCSDTGEVLFARYRRHYALTVETVREMLSEALSLFGDVSIDPVLTGSAALGIAQSYSLPFLQEVVASSRFVSHRWPDVKTFIELGGEDSKVIFFENGSQPDMRMNGSCAGGTGAFIDQMATLLGVSLSDFDLLSGDNSQIHPIASRCGVFAKTDVQSLLSNSVPRADIAASVFHSVALQVAATLFKGKSGEKKVFFAGGPLGFFPGLKRAFMNVLNLTDDDVVRTDSPELVAALGAALHHGDPSDMLSLTECIKRLETKKAATTVTKKLTPLFASADEYASWNVRHSSATIKKARLNEADGEECFLGIDSGSTTTKILLMDAHQRVLQSYYASNNGDPIATVRTGLAQFGQKILEAGVNIRVARTAVTGYGEDLIKAAFGIDDGVVETLAHYRAARAFSPDVSFILDIGGQDMKAIFIRDGSISDIQINEACSSGCGSFIETFARSLDYDVETFARVACNSNSPFDLGTRCTVFMNSKVKQAQSEGATVEDISAGLAYAVIKNSLYKVLKLTSPSLLGDTIVVQGGTFRNPAVLRAFEILTGKNVIRPDIPELMGAYGAAITSRDNHLAEPRVSDFAGFFPSQGADDCRRDLIHCRGCENACPVTRLTFANSRRYFTGNRCENTFSNSGRTERKGKNIVATKMKILFDQSNKVDGTPILTFGIPRALNFFEDFPFWSTYLAACGFQVVLSGPSTVELFEKAVQTVMSDNICFPGKLVHGHVYDLIEKKVDRIFYPNVIFEKKEHASSSNSYNCPVVTGYPDVVRSAIDPEGTWGIPLDTPTISFQDPRLLGMQLRRFVKTFGVSRTRSDLALKKALEAQDRFKAAMIEKGKEILDEAERDDRLVIVLAARPYHLDPLINHGIPELLTSLGVHVLTEDALPLDMCRVLKDNAIIAQWEYPNRILAAAEYVGTQKNMRMVQLVSFGCGLDALSSDESRRVLEKEGHPCTVIKIDEIANLGAARIRLRSLLEASIATGRVKTAPAIQRTVAPISERTVLMPWVSPMYSPIFSPLAMAFGIKMDILPPQDRSSVELGLQYVNNDVCYPAIIIVGDVLRALRTGRYDPSKTSFFYAQTFGQCRATNYLPLARKALESAGFGDVVTLSISDLIGRKDSLIKMSAKEVMKKFVLGVIFADALARLYYGCAPREIVKGKAAAIQQKYLDMVGIEASRADKKALLSILRQAIAEFNAIPTTDEPIPLVGMVGEIYVTYNGFSNNNIVDWFIDQGVEVLVPSLFTFFAQYFTNERYGYRTFLVRSRKSLLMTNLLDFYSGHFIRRVEEVMSSFRYYRKPHDLTVLAKETEAVASLANQAGEGWLLTAEMISMIHSGVQDIVCAQPFGCLANHITGKGISRRLKELYPQTNVLFLDMDAGHSEVNLLNRLHFINLKREAG
jgi:predicted CoA-substrate-specific enzyme activase